MALTMGVDVSPRDRAELERWLRSPSMPAGLVMRAKIVLAAAEGARTGEIVQRVGVSKPTVIAWRNRYLAEGIGGLDDRPKAGRPRQIDDVAIVQATLDPPPERLGVTHWSTRLLAAHLGVSNYTVAKAWQRWGLKPWRRQTFKFSTDPELEAKIRDVVGLYPPTVLSRASRAGSTADQKAQYWHPPIGRIARPATRPDNLTTAWSSQ
jgi:transposase